MASAVGVIFTNLHGNNVPELVRRRTMASIPFGGRYRLIDFPLSNMVNSGITTVGLMTNNNYRSLIDHIGSGKDWDLARKDGGIILLPPYSDENEKPYTNRFEALRGLTSFLRHRREKYVVLSDSDGVARMDISDIIDYHEEKNADITMVTHSDVKTSGKDSLFVTANEKGRVISVKVNPHIHKETEADVYVNVAVINRQFLLNLIEDADANGYTSFEGDIISKQLNSLKIYRYDFKGYYAVIDSMASYFKHNMELLDQTVRNCLFGARDIYTKVRDSAPSKYGVEATVTNSLISDGCEI
ncbi:MAG: glucose-1-phosphate adenylyltransferase subunit GlgD, partial [Clostridia bacterium]|nr:glucose-1-phosphate adenylyltransferase subunit GlgD [Clostridia bacterium]